MPSPANRLKNLPPYVFSVISDRIREITSSGVEVFRLDIGNPDLPPPDNVIDALVMSAQQPGNHGYSSYRGLPGFREAVADFYQRRFNVALDPTSEVLPVIGSKEGLVNLTLAYLDKDDVALVPDLGYPAYSMGARLAGAEVYWVHLDPARGYLPDLQSVPSDIMKRAKILWVNYPNNPTGATATVEDYEHLIQVCSQNDILFASDNPYMDVTFDGYRAPSALQAWQRQQPVIEFLSLSKGYNMAGWRLGAAVGSAEAVQTLLKVKSNIDSGHFKPVYEAGIVALKTPDSWIAERNQVYRRRQHKILDALPTIGLSAHKTQASLYVWAKVQEMTSQAYVNEALEKAHVSVAPGEAYGPGGSGYVRLSLGVPDEQLETALSLLKDWYHSR